jgi:hypothetical protein
MNGRLEEVGRGSAQRERAAQSHGYLLPRRSQQSVPT